MPKCNFELGGLLHKRVDRKCVIRFILASLAVESVNAVDDARVGSEVHICYVDIIRADSKEFAR